MNDDKPVIRLVRTEAPQHISIVRPPALPEVQHISIVRPPDDDQRPAQILRNADFWRATLEAAQRELDAFDARYRGSIPEVVEITRTARRRLAERLADLPR